MFPKVLLVCQLNSLKDGDCIEQFVGDVAVNEIGVRVEAINQRQIRKEYFASVLNGDGFLSKQGLRVGEKEKRKQSNDYHELLLSI